MKRLLKYKDGSEYIDGDIASITPNGVEPVETYDLDNLSKDDIIKLRENKRDKNILKKVRRI